jgi:hypothetical protein
MSRGHELAAGDAPAICLSTRIAPARLSVSCQIWLPWLRWPPRLPGLEPQDARGRSVRAAFVAITRARDQLDLLQP